MNEHGFCKKCKMDFDGDLIYDHFLREGNPPKEALRIAKMYGATRTTGRWGKKIGIYDLMKDRTVAYKCPECGEIQ